MAARTKPAPGLERKASRLNQPAIDNPAHQGAAKTMKTITIAFDCDGTLISNIENPNGQPRANERIRGLLVALASFKNTKIIVWSGGGEMYARQIGAAIGIDRYVDLYASKNHVSDTGDIGGGIHAFEPDIIPDIAIDDIQVCNLGALNLIVREK